VRALAPDERAGPWSAPQRFTVEGKRPLWPWFLLLVPLWILG